MDSRIIEVAEILSGLGAAGAEEEASTSKEEGSEREEEGEEVTVEGVVDENKMQFIVEDGVSFGQFNT